MSPVGVPSGLWNLWILNELVLWTLYGLLLPTVDLLPFMDACLENDALWIYPSLLLRGTKEL